MSAYNKRATIYLEPELHKALKFKAAESSKSISELVNEAVKESLAGYADDNETDWLDQCFQLMDSAEADSGEIRWKREDLYDI